MMIAYSLKSFFRHLYYSIRTNEEWFEVKYDGWQVYHESTQPIRAVYYVFWRIWKYRSILWNDFDWDHNFLLAILELKFTNMMKYHRDHGITDSSPELVHELSECAEICHRLRENDYGKDLDELHEEKWGKTYSWFEPAEEYGVDKLGKPKMFAWHAERPNALTDEDKEQERQEHRNIWEIEEQRKKADLERLAELIRTRTEYWWD